MIRCGYTRAHHYKTPDFQDRILYIRCIDELFAKFAAWQLILPANLRFCLFNIECEPVKNAV